MADAPKKDEPKKDAKAKEGEKKDDKKKKDDDDDLSEEDQAIQAQMELLVERVVRAARGRACRRPAAGSPFGLARAARVSPFYPRRLFFTCVRVRLSRVSFSPLRGGSRIRSRSCG